MQKPMFGWLTVLTTAMIAFAGQPAASLGNPSETAGGTLIGQPAPDFSLKDQNGKNVKLSGYKGKIIVLEWVNPDCPFIQRHYKEGTFNKLNDVYAPKGIVLLAINSGQSATRDKAFAAENHITYPVLDDSAGTVGKAYGAKSTPHMFVINQAGVLVYKGAIDNDPQGNKTHRVNYVTNALDELLAGKPVTTPETKSYGCGIHYK